ELGGPLGVAIGGSRIGRSWRAGIFFRNTPQIRRLPSVNRSRTREQKAPGSMQSCEFENATHTLNVDVERGAGQRGVNHEGELAPGKLEGPDVAVHQLHGWVIR